MFRLRSFILLSICAFLIGGFGPGVSPSFADKLDPASYELPPVKGGVNPTCVNGDEDSGDPDDYGVTIPIDSPETKGDDSWTWGAFVAWLSDVVSFRI